MYKNLAWLDLHKSVTYFIVKTYEKIDRPIGLSKLISLKRLINNYIFLIMCNICIYI